MKNDTCTVKTSLLTDLIKHWKINCVFSEAYNPSILWASGFLHNIEKLCNLSEVFMKKTW